MSAPANLLDFGIGFKSFSERVAGERQERIALGKNRLRFGVSFLDRALGGIFPNDLVLLGAKTGRGKTELATLIAMVNVRAGKRVHYFALEAEPREIERRLKYKLLANMVFQSTMNPEHRARMNYMDWYTGDVEDITGRFDADAEKVLSEEYATLRTYYRGRDFSASEFERMVLSIQDQTDLVILDHLHYVDSDDPNENRGYKAIVKKIRDTALSVGKPVLVVAHVRKSDRRSPQLVPNIEDFHGSSDITKIGTKAIMIAPAFDQDPTGDTHRWKTYIRPAKCRPDGARTRFTGVVVFNTRTACYEPDYSLGTLVKNGERFEQLPVAQWPRWAQ